ncbi:MAG: SRPBCC family protein [Thaumarchaeota archaeon]|nr:SRPBCC family protein [Nitrososphaerota archaeon]
MKTRTIRQTVNFKADPHDVYELLMDFELHSKFTGSKATINREIGGKVEAYDGYLEGSNKELIPDKKIVQKWRGSDWPEDWCSTATFQFKKAPKGTKMIFVQTGVPDNEYQSTSEGWVEYYWERMSQTLSKRTRN